MLVHTFLKSHREQILDSCTGLNLTFLSVCQKLESHSDDLRVGTTDFMSLFLKKQNCICIPWVNRVIWPAFTSMLWLILSNCACAETASSSSLSLIFSPSRSLFIDSFCKISNVINEHYCHKRAVYFNVLQETNGSNSPVFWSFLRWAPWPVCAVAGSDGRASEKLCFFPRLEVRAGRSLMADGK